MEEQRYPSQTANQEPVEDSRETVDASDEQGSGQGDRFDNSDTQSGERDENAGGITNRPLDEEIANQREIPPRGDVRAPKRDDA